MKMWLNNRKVKESGFSIHCHRCIFNRNPPHDGFLHNCLLRILNLRTDHDWCFKGYFYENMVK
jgi:hypothetical protein